MDQVGPGVDVGYPLQRIGNPKHQPITLGDLTEGMTTRSAGVVGATPTEFSSTERISPQIVELLGWFHRSPVGVLSDSQFETLLDQLDSYDENMMLNWFIWGLQPELAQSISLLYPKNIAQSVSLAENTKLAVKPSRRPSGEVSTIGGSSRAPNQSNRG